MNLVLMEFFLLQSQLRVVETDLGKCPPTKDTLDRRKPVVKFLRSGPEDRAPFRHFENEKLALSHLRSET
jgi:hypothetical protein